MSGLILRRLAGVDIERITSAIEVYGVRVAKYQRTTSH